MNFTEFQECPLNFILKFRTLILTEKIQSYFFTVTETLNSDKYMMSLPLWVQRRHVGGCAKSENQPTQKSYSMSTS